MLYAFIFFLSYLITRIVLQLAAQQHELTLTRHYETLLLSRESQNLDDGLLSNASLSDSLQRIAFFLRRLMESEDWALERECEISRLEKENEELRRLLGIDDANMTALGVSVDPNRVESGRYSTLLSSSSRRRRSSGDDFSQKSSYWDINSQSSQQQQQQHQQQIQLQQRPPSPAGPSRTMELQPGMRAGPQARRAGMFGASHQRGGFMGGVGRAMAIGLGTPSSLSAWGNPAPPSPAAPTTTERLWQPQASTSTGDLLR